VPINRQFNVALGIDSRGVCVLPSR
jgi:hypothetical protein